MGNQQGAKPSEIGTESNFKKYWIEMQRNPVSQIPPYRHIQITMLKKLFQELDKKKNKSIILEDFDHYYALRQHPLYPRIRILFKQQLQKIKLKRITFEIMLHLLEIFHIETEVQKKYQYLFRLYDWDGDFKLSVSDLVQTFQILFYGPAYKPQIYTYLAETTINKYGSQGFLKLQNFIGIIPEDQISQLMTLKFLEL